MDRETTPLVSDSEEPELQSSQQSSQLWTIIPALWTGSFMCAIDGTIVSTTMSRIASSMNDSTKVSWIATSYLLTNAAFQPLYGKASDVFGRRTMLSFAQLTFTLGCIACAMSTTVLQFSLARALAGVGGGGLAALSSIIVSDVVPLNKRGIFQGYANLMFGVGQMLGGPIGGLCVETIGWRYMFGIQVIPMLLAAFLCVKNVPYFVNEPDRKVEFTKENFARVDLGGSLTLAALVAMCLTLFSGPSSAGVMAMELALTAALLALFVFIESRVKEQVVPMFIFQGVLRKTALIAMFGTMTLYATFFILPLYLQLVHGLSPAQSGMFNAVGVISLSLGSLLGGMVLQMDDRADTVAINTRACLVSALSTGTVVVGIMINLAVIALFAPTTESGVPVRALAVLGIGYSITGLGYGAFLVSLLVTVVATVGPKNQAIATGMNYVFRSLGSVIGVGVSLNVYTKLLDRGLSDYFGQFQDSKLGKELLDKLLANAVYVRELDLKYRLSVLYIFQSSLSVTQVLVLVFSLVSFAIGFSLKWDFRFI